MNINNMPKQINIKQVREAVANYIYTEGCSCCEGTDHFRTSGGPG